MWIWEWAWASGSENIADVAVGVRLGVGLGVGWEKADVKCVVPGDARSEEEVVLVVEARRTSSDVLGVRVFWE